jgi:trehalose 6-phosphate synthase/phosphatase
VPRESLFRFIKSDNLGTRNKKPSDNVIKSLVALAEDPRNTIFIITGSSSNSIESTMGSYKTLGLVSDFGMYRSWPGEGKREWVQSERMETLEHDMMKTEWHPIALSIMENTTWRTNGSFIMDSGSLGTLEWNFRLADPEWGKIYVLYIRSCMF